MKLVMAKMSYINFVAHQIFSLFTNFQVSMSNRGDFSQKSRKSYNFRNYFFKIFEGAPGLNEDS